jgi:glycosyltransferase involved in cell wall biosynthesis
LAGQGRNADAHRVEPRRAIVLLAFHYPPMVGPASERAAAFVRHLPETAWDPIVVTVKRGLYHSDPGNRAAPSRTLRTRSPEPARLLGPLRDRSSDRDSSGDLVAEPMGGPALDRVRRLVRDYIYVPDGQVPWIPFAVAGLRRALQAAQGPKLVMSSSVPYSAHLAALVVARSERVPWIAELRDPWSLIDDRIRPRSRARKRADAALESRVIAAASGVVVTSELTREEMVRAYPELTSRCWVVRNGFEPLVGSVPAPPQPTAPMELIHAGSVPPGISVLPLLRGVGRVARARPGEVRLRVVGPREPWHAAATSLGGLDWLQLDGLIDPPTARWRVAAASVSVLLRPGEVNRQYVSAKLMDYLGARRPILGVISPTGEMAQLARDYGDLRLVEPNTEASVALAVEALLREHRQGHLHDAVEGRRPLAELTRQAQSARLAAVLEAVL